MYIVSVPVVYNKFLPYAFVFWQYDETEVYTEPYYCESLCYCILAATDSVSCGES